VALFGHQSLSGKKQKAEKIFRLFADIFKPKWKCL
jgi:hypothetical protein